MVEIRHLLTEYGNQQIALYGLGTETERFLSEFGSKANVVGLLDGFRKEGTFYGYPVISLAEVVNMGVRLIIVIARPGSCKVIARRIGSLCCEKEIALYDVRGQNLLENNNIVYDFRHLNGATRQELQEQIDEADVVSFDLFDTLITRKVRFYTDVFELLDLRLREKGIHIFDFVRFRLEAEKELSRDSVPCLIQIYEYVLKKTGGNFITALELADMEWEIDCSVMLEREHVCEIFRKTVLSGRKVVITTDTYYSYRQIKEILNRFQLSDCDKIFVSSEYGTSKTENLFRILRRTYEDKEILHIGDDEVADIGKASAHGISTFRIYSGEDLFNSLGELGMRDDISTLSDRLRAGMFISRMFNSPFWFENEKRDLLVKDVFEVGYLFCAPVIADFVLWLKEEIAAQNVKQVLFGARDGYLVGKLFQEVSSEVEAIYFLTSRTAAIRAGMESESDIAYVDSMKYFGSDKRSLEVRFGIAADGMDSAERNKKILLKADAQRNNYQKYIRKLDIQDDDIVMFDFVAKGTAQMYLQKLFSQHIKGYYFLQLEPEFMSDKNLDIQPFYLEEEKNISAIFDNYYILETMLTSPYAQVEEFDDEGNPVFADETRSKKDIQCFERAQEGILLYFREYLSILPKAARLRNKKLDELFLSLINKVQIKDMNFLKLKIEDPFFGRMTDMKDVIG